MRNHSSCGSSGESIGITERSNVSLRKLEAFQETQRLQPLVQRGNGVEKHSSEH